MASDSSQGCIEITAGVLIMWFGPYAAAIQAAGINSGGGYGTAVGRHGRSTPDVH